MKSSDEIKKGLEEEIPVHYHIDGEPRLTPRLLMDMQWLHKDALALIQQLQDDNAEKDKRTQQLERSLSFARDLADGLKAATVKQEQELYVSEERNRQLEAQNAEKDARIQQLEAERDAAVAGLKSNCTCPECKYFSDDIQDPCRGCKPTDSKFEWRGVQKEESEDGKE